MRSVVLSTTARFLLPLFLIFSLFLLLRGHNDPGGGFTGGLVAAAGFALYAMAFGATAARVVVFVDLRSLMAVGLLLAVASSLVGVFVRGGWFAGVWVTVNFGPEPIKIGTPFLFDIGVYLVVIGMSLSILLNHLQEAASRS